MNDSRYGFFAVNFLAVTRTLVIMVHTSPCYLISLRLSLSHTFRLFYAIIFSGFGLQLVLVYLLTKSLLFSIHTMPSASDAWNHRFCVDCNIIVNGSQTRDLDAPKTLSLAYPRHV